MNMEERSSEFLMCHFLFLARVLASGNTFCTYRSREGGFTAGKITVVEEDSLQDREQFKRMIHCRTENSCGGGFITGQGTVVEKNSLQD
jgi:hypothetical protein